MPVGPGGGPDSIIGAARGESPNRKPAIPETDRTPSKWKRVIDRRGLFANRPKREPNPEVDSAVREVAVTTPAAGEVVPPTEPGAEVGDVVATTTTSIESPEDLAKREVREREAEDAVIILTKQELPDAVAKRIAVKLKENKDYDFTKENEFLELLKTADDANGEAGMYLKRIILLKAKDLKDPEIDKTLDDRMSKIDPEADVAKSKIEAHLTANGVTDEDKKNILDAMESGDIEGLVKSGIAGKTNGLEKLILGKEMTEEKRENLIHASDKIPQSTKEKLKEMGKTLGIGIGGIILLIFLGLIQASVMASNQRN